MWQWENATAGALAGFATVAAMHPLDVVRTRFQGSLLMWPLKVSFCVNEQSGVSSFISFNIHLFSNCLHNGSL